MTTSIVFNMINVNTLDTDSTIAVGENAQNNWQAHSKNNFGVGMNFGWNFTSGNFNLLNDTDVIDSPINDQDIQPSGTVQL